MDILDICRNICNYYRKTPRVGHTQAMLHGTLDNTSVRVIVPQYAINEMKKHLGEASRRCVSLQMMDLMLQGIRVPLAFDNTAIEYLASSCAQEITDLRDKVKEQKRLIDHYSSKAHALQDHITDVVMRHSTPAPILISKDMAPKEWTYDRSK